MSMPSIDPSAELSAAVDEYVATNEYGPLLERLLALAGALDVDTLIAAAERYREMPEVIGPLYERIVAARPEDARALVMLANAYWLTGRGAAATGELAARALAADPTNRAAWHLWALTEPDLRERLARWQHVAQRFAADDLARANLADTAASLASTERDRGALQLAVHTYRELLGRAPRAEQRAALEQAIATLESWRL